MFRLFAAAVGGTAAAGFAYKSQSQPALAQDSDKKRVVIVGAGTGGCAVAAQLAKKRKDIDITVIDPQKEHFYQPGFTLVGANLMSWDSVRKPQSACVTGGKLVTDKVTGFSPKTNSLKLQRSDGQSYNMEYDQLVVATGIVNRWDKIKGGDLVKTADGVCSNYEDPRKTGKVFADFPKTGGVGVFTMPSGPFKCGGAPQKIMHLLWDNLNFTGAKDFHLVFATPMQGLFAVKKYGDRLKEIAAERDIDVRYGKELKEIIVPPPSGTAAPAEGAPAFKGVAVIGDQRVPFHMLHATPPMSTPPEVASSALANPAGYVSVSKDTCQHTTFPNVWSLGDCSSIPTSKTAAAICRQAPVLVKNMSDAIDGKDAKATYNGYTSCPLITGVHPPRLLLMEFGYDGKVMESFPWDQGRDDGLRGRFHAFLKQTVFPPAYWRMLSGNWYGPSGPFAPTGL